MKAIPRNPDVIAVAQHIIWFEPPEQALAAPIRFLGYLMTYGTAEEIAVVRRYLDLADCPGRISDVETIDSAGKIFNPKGCYEYSWGKGIVTFQGMGGIETNPVDLAIPSPHIPWAVYGVRAVKGTTASFQYFLCAGPKLDADPKKLRCN